MQQEVAKRQAAVMLAARRDMFHFFGAFYAIAAPLMIHKARSGSPAAAAPLLPLTFMFAYQFDAAYGGKVERIVDSAEKIMDEEPHLIRLPHGFPTVELIDSKIAQAALAAMQSRDLKK